MIQDIGPHRYDNSYRKEELAEESFVCCFYEEKILLKEEEEKADGVQDGEVEKGCGEKTEGNWQIPTAGELAGAGLIPSLRERAEYLFSIDNRAYFMVRGQKEDPAAACPVGYGLQGTPYFRIMEPEYQAFAAVTAMQLWRWKESRRFCGCCGHETVDSDTERALVCPACGHIEYPKICPAVIVAVTDGDRLLMSRYRGREYRGYALIAGFVEIGETFEDTVRREVMEEVGLKVKNIRYYKSQPWAFTDTEMIGFFADLDGDDHIRLEEDELAEAGWYHREEIPEDESHISVGSEMKMRFKHGLPS